MGVDNGIVRKSGAWYTYEGDQLGQGKENARAFLRDNPDLADEIEKRIKEKLGIGAHARRRGGAPVAEVDLDRARPGRLLTVSVRASSPRSTRRTDAGLGGRRRPRRGPESRSRGRSACVS